MVEDELEVDIMKPFSERLISITWRNILHCIEAEYVFCRSIFLRFSMLDAVYGKR